MNDLNLFLAQDNIYISHLSYDVCVRLSVCLSVTEVHWRIIANLGFKFRSHFIVHCCRRRPQPPAAGAVTAEAARWPAAAGPRDVFVYMKDIEIFFQ